MDSKTTGDFSRTGLTGRPGNASADWKRVPNPGAKAGLLTFRFSEIWACRQCTRWFFCVMEKVMINVNRDILSFLKSDKLRGGMIDGVDHGETA